MAYWRTEVVDFSKLDVHFSLMIENFDKVIILGPQKTNPTYKEAHHGN